MTTGVLIPASKSQQGQPTRPVTYLYLYKIDGFHQSGLGSQGRGIQNPPCSWNDLPTTPVDGISMESNIMDVKANSPHVLLTQNALQKTTVKSGKEKTSDCSTIGILMLKFDLIGKRKRVKLLLVQKKNITEH